MVQVKAKFAPNIFQGGKIMGLFCWILLASLLLILPPPFSSSVVQAADVTGSIDGFFTNPIGPPGMVVGGSGPVF